jgi:hypothetical protein
MTSRVNWEVVYADHPYGLEEFARQEISLRTLMNECEPEARRELRKVERVIGVISGRKLARKALSRR